MDEIQLKATLRKEAGKEASKRLRREGWIPAILYGHGEEPRSLLIEKNSLRLFKESDILSLEVDEGKSRKILVKEVQKDFISGEVLHLDFQVIHEHEKITVEVSIHLEGQAVGVKEDGGTLEHLLRSVRVRCLPAEVPKEFKLDISSLRIGDAIHVKELALQYPNLSFEKDPEETLLTITAPKVEEEVVKPAVEEEVKEPEVIGREKKEEEEEEEEKVEEEEGR